MTTTPMTAAQQLTQFQKWGIVAVPYKEWQSHNRAGHGAWGPVHGLMVHHTGSDGTDQRELLYNGTGDLPGPLCQWGISQDGRLHLIGNGRCNHAGLGDPDVLNAVINENYADYPPTDNQATVDGNARFYGVEIWYSGSHGMTPQQYATLLRLAAAVTEFHTWTKKSVIAHGEWQPGKWDPGYASGKMMDMRAVRNDIGDVRNRYDLNADGDTVDAGEKNASVPVPPVSTVKTYTTKKGDTVVFPGGGKVVVQ